MFVHCHFSSFITVNFLFASQLFYFSLKLQIVLVKLVVLPLRLFNCNFQFFSDFLVANLLLFGNLEFFILLFLNWSLAWVHVVIVLLRLTLLTGWLLVFLLLLNDPLLAWSSFDLVLRLPFFLLLLNSLFLLLIPPLPFNFILLDVFRVWVDHTWDSEHQLNVLKIESIPGLFFVGNRVRVVPDIKFDHFSALNAIFQFQQNGKLSRLLVEINFIRPIH